MTDSSGTWSEAPAPDPQGQEAAVSDFWNLARFHAKLNHIPGYFGQTALESVPPPSWSFGGTPEESDAALTELLDGSGTSTRAPLADYETTGEPLPQKGTLGIVLDGRGTPRALVATTDVEVSGAEVVEHLSVLWADDPSRP